MGQGSLGEVESIVSPVAEAVARELEPVQRSLTQAGAQVCTQKECLLNQPFLPGVSGRCWSSGTCIKIIRACTGILQKACNHNFAKSHLKVSIDFPYLACVILFRFRAALNLDLAEQEGKTGVAPEVPPGPPVSDATFRSFLNKVILWSGEVFHRFEHPCPSRWVKLWLPGNSDWQSTEVALNLASEKLPGNTC